MLVNPQRSHLNVVMVFVSIGMRPPSVHNRQRFGEFGGGFDDRLLQRVHMVHHPFAKPLADKAMRYVAVHCIVDRLTRTALCSKNSTAILSAPTENKQIVPALCMGMDTEPYLVIGTWKYVAVKGN
jgi:hypothetical protein